MSRKEAETLIDSARNGRAQKRLGAELDEPGQEVLRAAIVAVAQQRGVELEPGAETWPGKKLLRRAQGREATSRVRKNPIARDEAFLCEQCGSQVLAHGRTARDHCPECLYSLHVDVVPGDRAAACGGLLRPVAMELRAGHPFLIYRCEKCGERRVNQAILDGASPDSFARVTQLPAGSTRDEG